MPAWLSPRVRLGATASLIVLIACALLLTPHLFHDDDADAPVSLTSESASVDLLAPSPLSPVLPRRVPRLAIDGSVPGSSPPSRALWLRNDLDSPANDTESDSSPAAAPDPVVDWVGQNPFAAQGVAWPLFDCPDCGPTPRLSSQFTHPLFFEIAAGGGPGGGVGGGRAPDSDTLPPVTVTDFDTPPTSGNGPGDQTSSTPDDPGPPRDGGPKPPIDLNGPEGPGDPHNPDGPDPGTPEVVQVPEPSAFVMAGMGVLSVMTRARLARKRRG
jgi:hypothetical protein